MKDRKLVTLINESTYSEQVSIDLEKQEISVKIPYSYGKKIPMSVILRYREIIKDEGVITSDEHHSHVAILEDINPYNMTYYWYVNTSTYLAYVAYNNYLINNILLGVEDEA